MEVRQSIWAGILRPRRMCISSSGNSSLLNGKSYQILDPITALMSSVILCFRTADMIGMKTNGGLSTGHEMLVRELYTRSSRTVDDLPYTDEFDQLYAEFVTRSGRRITQHDFWRAIANARKAGRLMRKRR